MNQITSLYNKYMKPFVNREVITYGIFGVLTTVVNYVTYYLFTKIIGYDEYVSNIIAWIVAVIFAYIVNQIWVFQSKNKDFKDLVEKVVKFFGARVFSLGVEVLGLYIFYTLLGFNDLLVKAGLAFVVIVMNYIFSKLFIFKK